MSTCTALKALLKTAGYHNTISHHFPECEEMEKRVTELERIIKQEQYTRMKSAGGGAYSYEYNVGHNIITFNYRDADTGLAGWYIS